jgi:hypothetical protein
VPKTRMSPHLRQPCARQSPLLPRGVRVRVVTSDRPDSRRPCPRVVAGCRPDGTDAGTRVARVVTSSGWLPPLSRSWLMAGPVTEPRLGANSVVIDRDLASIVPEHRAPRASPLGTPSAGSASCDLCADAFAATQEMSKAVASPGSRAAAVHFPLPSDAGAWWFRPDACHRDQVSIANARPRLRPIHGNPSDATTQLRRLCIRCNL